MHGYEAVSPGFAGALREELVLTSRFLHVTSLIGEQEVVATASLLTSPWWELPLDVRLRRSVVRRISNRLCKSTVVPAEVVRAAAKSLRHKPIASIEDHWTVSVLARAATYGLPFPDTVRTATTDALWLAKAEVDGAKSRYPLELAIVYDPMVLTSAYGLLHTLRAKPDSLTLKTASQILGHAALVSDRAK